MKIGIIGGGVVGTATAEAFKDHEICIYDLLPDRSYPTHTSICDVLESDLVFICLPTPQKESNLECDTSTIDEFLWSVVQDDRFSETNLVLRSTVPVGYTRLTRQALGLTNLVHSPEFLTARTAKEDACNPTRMVIGCRYEEDFQSTVWDSPLSIESQVLRLYRERWPRLEPFLMTSDESEFLKLLQNSLSAIKIAALNEAHLFASKKGLDWHVVMEALLAGGWINPMHTKVPGPDGKFGFGGACLPKDVASLGYQMLIEDLRADMCLGAYARNLTDREREV